MHYQGPGMKIGITYDLREDYIAMGYGPEETAEFDKIDTIEGIEAALQALGYKTERIGHLFDLVKQLGSGKRWDLVFNIAEGLKGYGRESAIPCLLEAYDIPYTFSDPLTLAVSLHKGMCKQLVQAEQIPTAPFRIVNCIDEVERIDLPWPVFVKPVAEGTGKGISSASKITSMQALIAACRSLLHRFAQPVLVETFLPGREFTVGIVGTGKEARCIGVIEVTYRNGVDAIYSYATKENYTELVDYGLLAESPLKSAIDEVALQAWRILRCRDGGRVDIRLDADGKPMFLEVNPLAGLNPVTSDLPILCRLAGWSYERLIGSILESTLLRYSMDAVKP